MIKRKVGTITLALGLIIAGALMFAQNFTQLPIENFYKYWPVLLISLGAELFIFSAIYGKNEENVRLGIDKLCIVFIILVGMMANTGKLLNFDLHFGDNDIFDFNSSYRTQIKEHFSKEKVSQGLKVKEVKIKNEYGRIEVKPSNSDSVRVEAEIKVKCNDENKARAYAKEAVKIIEGERTEISVLVPSDNEKKNYSKAVVDFTVYIPDGAIADAENSFGEVSINDIKSDIRIKNSYGAITVKNILGNADIKNSFGQIELKSVSGKANVKNQNGEIIAEAIGKDAVLETHFGAIDADNIGGSLSLENNNGNIDVDNVSGKAEIKGSFGSIDVSGVKGDLDVLNSNGQISVDDAAGDVKIKNSFGEIDYESDNISDAEIYAKTSFGNIDSDITLPISKSGQESKLEGKMGTGKYKIEITNNNGDINLD